MLFSLLPPLASHLMQGDLNTVRVDFGLKPYTDFDQITDDMEVVAKLKELFKNIDEIDAWVGMLAEKHVKGAFVGQTHFAVFVNQFSRLRDCDRFWYERKGHFFHQEQLKEIKMTRYSDLWRRNTNEKGFQRNVFRFENLRQLNAIPDNQPLKVCAAKKGMTGYGTLQQNEDPEVQLKQCFAKFTPTQMPSSSPQSPSRAEVTATLTDQSGQHPEIELEEDM